MSVTSAARRLLRTLWVSQPTVTTDLQRDGRGGPATADGRWWWWWAAVDGAGTDSSSSTTSSSSCCFELELWPAANSRPLPPSSFSHSTSFPPSSTTDRRNNDLRSDGDCYSTPSGKANILKNAARIRSDTPSPRLYILGNSKTILSPPTSHIRLLPRSHSVDSISSTASTLISGASYTNDNSEGIRNRKPASPPSIVAWRKKPATRLQRTRSGATQRSTDKKGSSDELFWRGYWD
ncbi:hypothetical protein F4803DRAFT_546387 [Xylaria telfairii]|nr:hypothetical protein F4803DRAFT_546387 [Xylaria telfairii]